MSDDNGPRRNDLPNQGLFSTFSSNDEEDNEDEALNNSTSTAGPAGSWRKSTNKYFPRETGFRSSVNTSTNTSVSSPLRSYDRGETLKRTGSYRALPSGNRHSVSTGLRRSFSNSSTVVSLVGSVPEWSRSFCVFNSVRAASRRTVSHAQRFFGSKSVVSGTGAASSLGFSPAATAAAPGIDHHRPSVFFSTSPSMYVGVSGDCGVCRTTGTTLGTGHRSSMSASASVFLGVSRGGGRQSVFMGAPSSPTTATHNGIEGPMSVSPARKQLPLLLRSFSCYLGLTGKPIINGTVDHPLDTRRGPLIGVGGFAKVYAGVDCVSGRLVSIKEINIAEIDNIEALNAISREFGLLKSLQHPNIVSYYLFEHSASQKVCRIVMELLTGGSTLVLLEKYGPLSECILRKFARHILQAIAFIHKKGISHLDIKPANILVSDKGVVKLCDFGCSKRINELSKSTNCVLGTPLYMAPELIKGDANHKSDIWSMGCSLFELATGLLPWYHTNVRENIRLIFYITSTCDSPLVLPKEKNYNFSPEFLDFLEMCFIRNVSKRPEAADLQKHPWITGVCTKLVDNDVLSLGSYNSPHFSPLLQASSIVDEELECQQELEDTSAIISVEMCNAWMSMGGGVTSPTRQHLQPQSLQADVRTKSDDVVVPNYMDNRQTDLQGTCGGSWCHSPGVSSRGGGFPPLSPTTSLDTLQYDNFTYAIPCGASEGCFVLPSCSSVSVSPAAPQYLCINTEGCLDIVYVEEDMVKLDADVDDTFAGSFQQQFDRSPSFNYLLRSGTPTLRSGGGGGGGGGVTIQPPTGHVCHNTNSNSNSLSVVSAGRSPAGCYNRRVSMVYNPSMSLLSNSSFTSRGVSPSRRSQTALTGSLTTSQQLPSLLPMNGSMSLHPGASVNHSSEDITAEVQGSGQSGSIIPKIPEGIHRDPNGRLLMSFFVPVGHLDRQVNVEISVDPEDVQYKLIERRPSYVVAFSEDVRAQIAAKVSEVASSSVTTPLDTYGHGEANCATRSAFGGLHGSRSRSTRSK